jgi:antitoxin component of MazEF toxin-antitoxin module
MKTIIRKRGNSAGTIIPVPVLDATGIGLGDKVNIEAKAGTLVMTLVDEPMTL